MLPGDRKAIAIYTNVITPIAPRTIRTKLQMSMGNNDDAGWLSRNSVMPIAFLLQPQRYHD